MRRINNSTRRRVRRNILVRQPLGHIFFSVLSECWYFCVSPGSPMVRKIFRMVLSAGFGVGLLGAVGFLFFGNEAGCLEAKYDLWRHHFEIRTYTSDRAHVSSYREMLKPYGIAYRRVAISPFNPFSINHFEAYNRTMKQGIRDKLDLDVKALFRLFQVLEMIETDPEPKTFISPAVFGDEIG